MHNYIIEHLEEGMHEWCETEYYHMLQNIGGEHLWFTHLTPTTLASAPERLRGAQLRTEDVLSLGIDMKKICLLDPAAEKALSPEDGEKFEYFLFGGILGDHPPRDRTAELRKLGFEGRHLGSIQMSTDTAVNVTKRVIEDKIPLDKIPYIDSPEVWFSRRESVVLPFRYIAVPADSKWQKTHKDAKEMPLLPEGMFELLKKDSDKSFEF
ncbi:uncharacterized protein VTP21DRAFT_1418 [Calcarisporiella thermophila]|uniref:uncharacterized protein n=1 Tax=Calcarisporiella thermophila TaxID=911321 RepID=UPI003743F770